MAVQGKGWRSISVDRCAYFWRANGTDEGIDVVIVGEQAFEPGQRAQQLRFSIEYRARRTAVTPKVVHQAILLAKSLSPPFTGEFDLADVKLSRWKIGALQDLASPPSPRPNDQPRIDALLEQYLS